MSNQTVASLVSDVKNWNLNNVSELLDSLTILDKLLRDSDDDRGVGDLVDMTKLPSLDVAADLNGTNGVIVWATDRQGNCLVGADAKKIQHISQISSHR
ncbi:hypothetical protein UFOVP244_129 [uncultured Caudovirales phage]|uniref:Uncharacterized protein n=1 Tax=uncultured Caudovirales phage TaxID=2100421 RepID=A0A6J7WU79_9CAUD|nr:hypothetical protein UFOVP244_129 [uncultured Caudovirales phage]